MNTTTYGNDSPLPSSAIDCTTPNTEWSTPVDIADIILDAALPREDRIRSYLQQIKNPYTFRCKGVIVKIAFSDTDETIEDRLEAYIRLKQMDQLCFSAEKSTDEERGNSIAD